MAPVLLSRLHTRILLVAIVTLTLVSLVLHPASPASARRGSSGGSSRWSSNSNTGSDTDAETRVGVGAHGDRLWEEGDGGFDNALRLTRVRAHAPGFTVFENL